MMVREATELQALVARSLDVARERGHEEARLGDVLLVLLDGGMSSEVLTEAGVSGAAVRSEMEKVLGQGSSDLVVETRTGAELMFLQGRAEGIAIASGRKAGEVDLLVALLHHPRTAGNGVVIEKRDHILERLVHMGLWTRGTTD